MADRERAVFSSQKIQEEIVVELVVIAECNDDYGEKEDKIQA